MYILYFITRASSHFVDFSIIYESFNCIFSYKTLKPFALLPISEHKADKIRNGRFFGITRTQLFNYLKFVFLSFFLKSQNTAFKNHKRLNRWEKEEKLRKRDYKMKKKT